ncbi:LamG domain-containing protein [Streptomyces sp. NPDC006367]
MVYAADEEPAAPAPLSEGQKALEQAQESGQQVEVVGERTERTTVFANPDGYTFTLEESSVPVRVPAPDGGWQKPDATLVQRADGTVGPKGAAVQMTFSGGGEDPLARIEDGGRALGLDWPGALPAPRLDGPSALYPEVLPGVDLQVTATPESFQHVLVVKSPEAATSDALRKLTFGLETENLAVRKGTAGNLAAVDGNGTTVFKAPPARMWDSAGQDTTSGTQTQLMTVATDAPVPSGMSEPLDPAETAPSGSGLEPGQGDTVARMDVEVGKDSLSVIPDTEMLTSTEESAFPVFIDPTVTWGESERTLLRSDGYESYGWGNGDDDQGKGAGKCGTWNGYYCGPGYVQKLYFEFSPSSLSGKQVLDATFRVTEPWAFQCDPRWVDLVRTNNISSSTTWSSRPKELDWMVDRYVSAGRGSLCDPGSADAPIEFNDNPEETNENLTPTVRDFAAGKFSRLTLELRAHDETDTSAWKRFKNDAVLAVDFVGLPDKPTSVGLQGGGTSTTPVCERNEGDPAVVSYPEPTLKATAQTKAGGEKDAQLQVFFDIDVRSGSTWADVPPGNGELSPSTGYVADGRAVSLKWSKLADGKLYRYHAWTWSYYNGGSSHLSSTASDGYCYFRIDSTRPKAPQITVGSPYSECTTNDCAARGGPGVKSTFAFKPATGDTNVAYQYKLSSQAAWSAELKGATATAVITPTRAGLHRVYVRAKDSIGWGAQSVVDFLVAAGDGPIGQWSFGEGSGTAADTATTDGRDDATLAGGAVRDDRGRRGVITHDSGGIPLETPVMDKGLALNGSTGYAATTTPVVETRGSYTLSTWARVDTGVNRTMTVLGQMPENPSPFAKKYTPFGLSYAGGGANTWSLSAMGADGVLHKATATQATPRGVWTHVVGVHDAEKKEMRLYLNGKLQATTDAGTSWETTGTLQIGRAVWADVPTDYFAGSIDETTVWQRALTPEEITDTAAPMNSPNRAAVELVADWSADRGNGNTIADTVSGYGRMLTLAGGASLDGEAIVLDGVDDAATASGPLVDETGSFTVTTEVAVDRDKIASKPVGYAGQVLGQRAADGSAWGIWFERGADKSEWDETVMDYVTAPTGYWRFGRLNADGTFSAVASTGEAVIGPVARLTGVLDASTGTISLYLNIDRNGDPQVFTAKTGTGDFAVGKGVSKTAWEHFLPARVTEARMWVGAMASPEQIGESVGG